MSDAPTFKAKSFQCPHCGIAAQQDWFDVAEGGDIALQLIQHLYLNYRSSVSDYQQKTINDFLKGVSREFTSSLQRFIPQKIAVSTCSQCGEPTLWVERQLVFPKTLSAHPPNSDLGPEIINIYNEASSIVTDSPKGAAALLRLALQKLLRQLGKHGKNINQDIQELVSDGLSPKIQQALDLVRVIGNNAVHPGEINLDDNREIAEKLFQILNFIAEEMITKPRELEELYNTTIPEHTRGHIRKRDGGE
ncbi:DUF4145 domain-containing protein [Aidingimonas halophila]|uniref:DUF4145 domain-containing protein n=1 Tax=Aidingimonas halophila TaxID=574349 RepID=A0A1H2ZYN5_9GAMM|nr:DUF4145 domain-containing protein [Aidingimonas halophila]GHC21188.1 hypothetical protein GCM10008094_09780 [Aidingimonas halophila]SDX22547.1 protein of unknown function [Aidingimonas halophila]